MGPIVRRASPPPGGECWLSPIRGRKDDEKQQKLDEWRSAVQAVYERLDALPLPELAAEVMIQGFGPGGPGADDDKISLGQANIGAGPSANDISFEFAPKCPFMLGPTLDDMKLRGQIAKLVAEGLQELEHASLVRCQMHTSSGYLDWAATRRGRAALESGDVERILQAVARVGSAD
jgi:hypothetical protein